MQKNKIEIPKHVCGLCGKSYTRKKHYENHVTFCKIRHQSKEESESIMNNEDKHLSIKDLNKIVKQLVVKTDKMEKEIKFLKGFVDKTIKCTDVSKILNQNHKAEKNLNIIDFKLWYHSLEPTEKDLELFFKSNYAEALFRFIKPHIKKQPSESVNIKAFSEKPNKLFVFENNNWKELDKNDFNRFVSCLRKKILNVFQQWQTSNSKAILNGDDHEDYTEKVLKIIGGNKSETAIANTLHDKIWNNIVIELKSMTMIEL